MALSHPRDNLTFCRGTPKHNICETYFGTRIDLFFFIEGR